MSPSTRSSDRSRGSGSTGTARSSSSSTRSRGTPRRLGELLAEGHAYEDDGAIRFRMPDEGTTAWDDAIKGRIEYPNEKLEDLVLLRSDGRPTYNLAAALDDADSGITHVIRGEDHVPNTPKQIRILEALGRDVPVYAHVPNVFGTDGKKLSKRHGAVSVEEFRAQGLPRARAHELPRAPRLELRRPNDGHVPRRARRALLARPRRLEPGDLRLREARLAERRLPARADAGRVRGRARRLPAGAGLRGRRGDDPRVGSARPGEDLAARRVSRRSPGFFFRRVEPPAELLDGAGPVLAEARETLAGVEPFTAEPIECALRGLAERLGLKPRDAFGPIRAAVTGSRVSPGLFESLELLGREESLARLDSYR